MYAVDDDLYNFLTCGLLLLVPSVYGRLLPLRGLSFFFNPVGLALIRIS